MKSLPISRIPDPALAPPLRWGVLAPGGIARGFVSAMLARTGQTVTAVGSRSAERAAAFAAEFGAAHSSDDYRTVVDNPAVDVVYVASPHSAHLEMALLAIAAGKHVLVEKAFTRNASEARQIVQAAERAGVLAMEAMWTRFLPGMDVARQLLADGALGEIRTVAADHGQYFDFDAAHRLFDPNLAGGALLDLGIYPISFASFVLGKPDRISAVGQKAATGVDGQVSAVLESGDAHAVINTTLFNRTPTTASISGTHARAEFAGVFYAPTTLTVTTRDGTVLTHDGGPIREHEGLAHEAAHLANLVAEGATESPLMPLTETVAILETIDEIRRQIGVRLPGE